MVFLSLVLSDEDANRRYGNCKDGKYGINGSHIKGTIANNEWEEIKMDSKNWGCW